MTLYLPFKPENIKNSPFFIGRVMRYLCPLCIDKILLFPVFLKHTYYILTKRGGDTLFDV